MPQTKKKTDHSLSDPLKEKKDKILEQALQSVPFEGWKWRVIENAAEKAGFSKDMAEAVFPGKLNEVISYFSQWADDRMLEILEKTDPESMRVRDRIRFAVKTRLDVLKPHKDAVRKAAGYWIRPFRKWTAGQVVWLTAHKIWNWAGDTSTDYNFYTKRGLLSGVLGSTFLAWLSDHSDNHEKTLNFLDRRIENVMQVGKLVGKIVGKKSGS